ncbi:TIGR00296 family protein [Halalkalirubrum salinum]|uniref:TIGR00296 family protein n=1 Tax=Halalkalirubrum salinum TaxID=2563889 RepID=UPI0010FB461D|nr:TIGR00296 family protein [Halalkalirubrum salinum]
MSRAQSVELSYDDGVRAVELAREAVESYVRHGQREHPGSMRETFYTRTGAFVRLQSRRGRGRLRGCAGSIHESDQLGHAIVEAAIQAASGDSAGSEVTTNELDDLLISVCVVCNTVLTDNPVDDLELGTHGVTIDTGETYTSMYPTLPVEHGWSKEKFLSRACRKAGLSPLAWQDDETMVTLFEGKVFRERLDHGSIESI